MFCLRVPFFSVAVQNLALPGSLQGLPLGARAPQLLYPLRLLLLVPAEFAAMRAALAVEVVDGAPQSAEEVCATLSLGGLPLLQEEL